ncbi:hypothetical protein MMC09_001975 [Bachmanniomyces sp. S44760]|nr:hypothetical protein [Bachmanniomyces sp. S44760]
MASSVSTSDKSRTHKLITSTCHCRALTAAASMPLSALPLKIYLCHCSVCRHATGQLASTNVALPLPHPRLAISGPRTVYATSTGPNGLERCFCPTCGAFVYEDSPNEKKAGLYGGTVDRQHFENGDIILGGHLWTEETGEDGGLATWLKDMPRQGNSINQGDEIGDLVKRASAPNDNDNDNDNDNNNNNDKLHATCHCGGVQFDITRPSPLSSGGSGGNPPDLKVPTEQWLGKPRPGDPQAKPRYVANICVCDSCRLCSGFELQPWCFIPHANILQSNNNPSKQSDDHLPFNLSKALSDTEIEKNNTHNSLKSYTSSPNATRYFCKTCGATIFYRCASRPELWDVSVGLLEGKSGARVEEWLDWNSGREISGMGDCPNGELVEMLRRGWDVWDEDEMGNGGTVTG